MKTFALSILISLSLLLSGCDTLLKTGAGVVEGAASSLLNGAGKKEDIQQQLVAEKQACSIAQAQIQKTILEEQLRCEKREAELRDNLRQVTEDSQRREKELINRINAASSGENNHPAKDGDYRQW